MFRGRQSIARRPARNEQDLIAPRPGELRGAQPPALPWRQLLFSTLPGRMLILAVSAKILVAIVGTVTIVPGFLNALDSAATLALLISVAYFLVKITIRVQRRLLWRVRRKLILSYVFIGFVPALLIVAFFVFGGLLMFLNVSSYLFKTGFDDVMEKGRTLAETTATEIGLERTPMETQAILSRKLSSAAAQFPGLSIALVPLQRGATGDAAAAAPQVAGPWRHLDPPTWLPEWVSRGGFGGVLAYTPADANETQLVIRAAGLPDSRDPAFAVIVDIPLDDTVAEQLRESTGIELQSVAVVPIGGEDVKPVTGRVREAATTLFRRKATNDGSKILFNWVTFFDYTDWDSGKTGQLGISTRVSPSDIYERISGAQSRLGNVSLGDLFLLALGVIGALFLIIEVVALIMGFALAKSITGAVHELFTGMERVREKDFTHQIQVPTRDQFGELADSFNDMTRSIGKLLIESDEKKRMEEELRIARQIQMSLLPGGPFQMPGLAITALCVPAREVGGDYYDFFRLSPSRLGILIADVSGKGTSAALYMAELKGLVLSLSEIYQSPRQLLIEVNRIISDNLDSRSFITMTYAVLDLQSRTLTYARAGHTPLIYLPGACGGRASEAQVLVPDGMVLGLHLDGFGAKFNQILEERTLRISTGDVLVLFTDGVTEAMNADSDLFGESRLSRLVEEHGHLPAEELRERILREIESFVGRADQHDDLTMILIKIEEALPIDLAEIIETVAV